MVRQYGNWTRLDYNKEALDEQVKNEVVELITESLHEGITGQIINTEVIIQDDYDEHGIKVDGWCRIAVKMDVEDAA